MGSELDNWLDSRERPWREVAGFLVVAFAFAAGYILLYDTFASDIFDGTAVGRITPYVAAWGPLIAITLVCWRSESSVRGWFDRQLTLSNRWTLYLVAFLLPIAVRSAAMAIFPATGHDLALSVSPVNFLLVFGFVFVMLGSLEEFGWRGYLQPALQARTNAVAAALLVGVVWTLWHLPMYVLGYVVDYNVGLLGLQLVAMSVVLAWLANSARGVVPAMVFHAAHNAPGNIFTVTGEVSSDIAGLYYPTYTALWLVVSGLVVAYAGLSLSGAPADATAATEQRVNTESG